MSFEQSCDRTGLPPELMRKSLDKLISAYVDNRLELLAHQREYNSVDSAISYMHSTNPKFKADAEFFVQLKDTVWTILEDLRADVLAGRKHMPSFDEVIALLPDDIKNI